MQNYCYDKEANDFYTNRDWRKMDGDRPWDWGNPTSSSPQTLLSHLRQGVLKGDGKGDIWYLKGNLSVAIKQYQVKDENGNIRTEYVYPGNPAPENSTWELDIYNMIMVMTPNQSNYHCGANSCVRE